jgi:NAD(P)-dependent dehydrogenase (short-subunit alcohol dehydrogenase family)
MQVQVTKSKRLDGRRALVTGAASGIGLATVQRLAAEGALVVMTDARPDAVAEAAQNVEPRSAVVATMHCDVGDESDVADAVRRAAEALDGLDTLVCSAGITRAGGAATMVLDEWDAVIRVNLTGTFLTIKHALPHLIVAGSSAIVTVGSVASLVAAGRAVSYDASKGGVLQLTKGIAVEFAEQGVRANCVCPGITATGLAANSSALHGAAVADDGAPPYTRLRVPMSRAADAAEIASAITFLCSDDASFITGASLAVDGGYTAI